MKLKSFEEWFAIRPNHSDEADYLPGRINFDLHEGIYLDTIWFSGSKNGDIASGQTLTGWLDYQRPATLIQPWVQSCRGSTISVDTPAMRESYRFFARALLKNVFLEDISAPIFTGLAVEHPAFHAWVNPCLVDLSWPCLEDTLSVDIQPEYHRNFTLADGTRAKITGATHVHGREATKLEEYTLLELKFPAPVNFDAICRAAWRVSAIFEFLIGTRVYAPVYYLPTTHKRRWNEEEQDVVAELWYRPAFKNNLPDDLPEAHHRLTYEKRSPVSLEALLNHVSGGSDELIFLADKIQSVEDRDLPLTQGYIELLGCLEAFDERMFGSGADENFKNDMRNLEELIEKHGSAANIALFKRIKGSLPNRFSLLRRLERLHKMWKDDGFRGNPDLKRIRDLRNIVPHGQGLEVSSDVAQELSVYRRYLTTLGRYHVLKVFGYTADQIAATFLCAPHRYGMFIPE